MTMGKVNKIALSTNDNKRLDFSLIDLISLWQKKGPRKKCEKQN